MTLSELLARPGVTEHLELRGTFGFLAFHGGPVERVTTMIASRAAEASGASFYAIDQPTDAPVHLPSTRFRPAESASLTAVLDHIDVVCTIHGYGREMEKQHLLLGGRNRKLAATLRVALDERLPDRFRVIDDIKLIPLELRGVHRHNPVNLPTDAGVQVELPPAVRWNVEAHDWADTPGLEPTTNVTSIVDALAEVASGWMANSVPTRG